MAEMFKASVFSRCKYGVKLLGKGMEEFKELNLPLNLEVSDASQSVIDAVKELGGSIKVVYTTPLILKHMLKPHKFTFPVKTPMPPPQKVLKLEMMKEKGLEVVYPKAPWFEDYKMKIQKEMIEAEKRAKTPGELLIPTIPMERTGTDKP